MKEGPRAFRRPPAANRCGRNENGESRNDPNPLLACDPEHPSNDAEADQQRDARGARMAEGLGRKSRRSGERNESQRKAQVEPLASDLRKLRAPQKRIECQTDEQEKGEPAIFG